MRSMLSRRARIVHSHRWSAGRLAQREVIEGVAVFLAAPCPIKDLFELRFGDFFDALLKPLEYFVTSVWP